MKLNISCPTTGCQKPISIDDDKKLSAFYGRRMGQEVEGDSLGDEFKGYVFKITGGNDKDGFAMKQGILVQGRVRILMGKGSKCYRPRRAGERKRKSVRGCVVGQDLSVMALSIVKVGEQPIAGLTDTKLPKRLGPKRATRIRKLFALTKEDDVRRFVIRRKIEKEGKPIRYKAPRIQRLVTDARLRRKRIYKASKKARWETTRKAITDYHKVIEDYRKKKATAHKEELQHKKDLTHAKHGTKEETGKGGAPAATALTGKKVDTKKDTKAAPTTGKTAATTGKTAPATTGKTAPAQTQQKAAPKTETKTAPKTETKAAPKTETKTVPKTETKTVPKTETKAAPKTAKK